MIDSSREIMWSRPFQNIRWNDNLYKNSEDLKNGIFLYQKDYFYLQKLGTTDSVTRNRMSTERNSYKLLCFLYHILSHVTKYVGSASPWTDLILEGWT